MPRSPPSPVDENFLPIAIISGIFGFDSVYLADRVVPMLPEALSNGLCSLRPDELRLAVTRLREAGCVVDELPEHDHDHDHEGDETAEDTSADAGSADADDEAEEEEEEPEAVQKQDELEEEAI